MAIALRTVLEPVYRNEPTNEPVESFMVPVKECMVYKPTILLNTKVSDLPNG
jgi:hypothetical protein